MLTGKYRKDEPSPEDSRLGFAKKPAPPVCQVRHRRELAKVEAYAAFAASAAHRHRAGIGWLLRSLR